MVKPDVKVNYYAALEVGSDASVEDIKKQYRKLALKYHPDRNPGKEEEFNSKFQAISAAHEILCDPSTKAAYDTGRRRANLSGAAPKPATAGRTGNPYSNMNQNFAPPPRRTADPTGWNRTGADRFTNFPGPSPTAKADPKRASYQDAWSAMGGGRRSSQKPANQAPPDMNQGQRRPPPPPVPPRGNQAPPQRPDLPKREADIRAGFTHRQAPPNMTAETRTAWAHYNESRADGAPQRPGISRSNTASKTPKRNAFDPSTPGSDERPTSGGTSGYTNHYKPGTTSGGVYGAGYQPQHQQQAQTAPGSGWSRPQEGSPDDRTQAPPPQHRHSTYQHRGSEKLHLNPEQLRRSNSTRDATRLHRGPQSPQPFHTRHRSASPVKYTNGKSQPKGFTVGGDDSSDTTESASSASSDADMHDTGAFGTRRRPKKIPTPPSIRMNGVSGGTPRSGFQSRRGSQAQQPSRNKSASAQGGQGPNGNMYEPFFHLSDSDTEVPASQRCRTPFEKLFGMNYPSARNVRPDNSIPPTHWPMSSSFARRSSRKEESTSAPSTYNDSRASTRDPVLVDISTGPQKTRSQPPSSFSQMMQSEYQQDLELLRTDKISEFVPHDFATRFCTFATSFKTSADPVENRFNMKFDFDKTDEARSRSAEHIDTTFSPTTTAPTFAGIPVGGPVSPSASRRSSPPKRPRETLSARPSRTHINTRLNADPHRMPLSPTAAPNPQLFGEVPTTGTPDRDNTFSPDQWQNSQFFAPQQAGLSRGPSVRRASASGGTKGDTGPRPASINSANEGENERDIGSNNSTGSGGDAMDVDPTPPASQGATSQNNARPYSVAPSKWRRSHQGMAPPPSAPSSDAATATAHARRRSSARSATGPTIPTNNLPDLTPLSATLNTPSGQGLNDLSSLSSTIPFPSKSSNIHPNKLFGETPDTSTPKTTPSGAPLPAVPVAPLPPQKMTIQSWRDYTARFNVYITAHHNLTVQFTAKSQELVKQEEAVLSKGPAGLDGREKGQHDVSALLERVREEERWNALRGIANERYRAALAEFVRLKGVVWDRRERGEWGE
ncbi:hypothetical protein KVT40_002747 [Elsinoe batatas]|uniref:J domain-containing protein n=2 Tax=Elsinoe TaxID=40996 RepID=A0A8K0L4A6_9PEZI|nr:hypothetical protein KVT40_002747 [Elsinoe batatas]